ncbi:MAG TPA: DUF805 domain-containing protein [Thiolapillus brandeum]|uniref:DUF805 domain-containing protein n=1 Tax=Thiolapillus brandeum TaxID=1076588 RepID=A0A831W720_9GAMM|nr:DUF805 domain-containing protein [Thiolapillus brandeum]
MFKALFGDVSNGRLARLPYLGYALLITVIMFGVMFGVVALMSMTEQIMNGNLQQIQVTLTEKLGLPFMLFMVVFMLALAFASMNIAAKRIRDMGLWGWTTLLILAVIGGVVGTLFPGEMTMIDGVGQMTPSMASSALQTIVFLCLLLIPSNSFGNRGQR